MIILRSLARSFKFALLRFLAAARFVRDFQFYHYFRCCLRFSYLIITDYEIDRFYLGQ